MSASQCSLPFPQTPGELIIDLIYRCGFFEDWVRQGQPKFYWMSGFFFARYECQIVYPNLEDTNCVLARYLSGSALDMLYNFGIYSWIFQLYTQTATYMVHVARPYAYVYIVNYHGTCPNIKEKIRSKYRMIFLLIISTRFYFQYNNDVNPPV